MKFINSIKIAATLVLALAMGSAARADLINGTIGFVGTFSTDNNADFTSATAFTSFSGLTFGAATGDYAPLSSFPATSSVYLSTFTPFSFAATSVSPLWTVVNLGITYSFDATSVNVTTTQNSIIAQGNGIASITGKDSTLGTWIITGNSAGGQALTFSASSAVPDGGMTAVMVGLGFIGMSFFARRHGKLKLVKG